MYELLVLRPAFESADRLKLIDMVTKSEPPPPRTLDSRIPRDLETIVLKSIDKDPKRRYQSADELADDLQHFVNDEPIKARRISTPERLVRWARRNPWLASATSVATAALVAVAALSLWFAGEQNRLNSQLVDANQEANALNDQLREANDSQQQLNQELVETNAELANSNQQRGDMIQSLRTGQSLLAQKQAQYDIEKGHLAEGMLWLARSYELAPEQNEELKREVLGQLSIVSEQIPRLRDVTEFPLDSINRGSARVGGASGVRGGAGERFVRGTATAQRLGVPTAGA